MPLGTLLVMNAFHHGSIFFAGIDVCGNFGNGEIIVIFRIVIHRIRFSFLVFFAEIILEFQRHRMLKFILGDLGIDLAQILLLLIIPVVLFFDQRRVRHQRKTLH